MITVNELKHWLSTHNSGFVAIDEGGLTLLILDDAEQMTGTELEVGGIPDDSPAWEGELTEGEIAAMDRLRNA